MGAFCIKINGPWSTRCGTEKNADDIYNLWNNFWRNYNGNLHIYLLWDFRKDFLFEYIFHNIPSEFKEFRSFSSEVLNKTNFTLLQALIKLYNVYANTNKMKYVMRFLQHIYKVHITTKSPARREYFRKFALFIEILFKGMYTIPREVKTVVKSIQIFNSFLNRLLKP